MYGCDNFVSVECVYKKEVKKDKFVSRKRLSIIPSNVSKNYVLVGEDGDLQIVVTIGAGFESLCCYTPQRLLSIHEWNATAPENMSIQNESALKILTLWVHGIGLHCKEVSSGFVCMSYDSESKCMIVAVGDMRVVISSLMLSDIHEFVSIMSMYKDTNSQFSPVVKCLTTDGIEQIGYQFIEVKEEEEILVNEQDITMCYDLDACIEWFEIDASYYGACNYCESPLNPPISVVLGVDDLGCPLKVPIMSYYDVIQFFNNCRSDIMSSIVCQNTRCVVKSYDNCFVIELCGEYTQYLRIYGERESFSRFLLCLMVFIFLDAHHPHAPIEYCTSDYCADGNYRIGDFLLSYVMRNKFKEGANYIPIRAMGLGAYCEPFGIVSVSRYVHSAGAQEIDLKTYSRHVKRDRGRSFGVWAPTVMYPVDCLIDMASYKTPRISIDDSEIVYETASKFKDKKRNIDDEFRKRDYITDCLCYFDDRPQYGNSNSDWFISVHNSAQLSEDFVSFNGGMCFRWEDEWYDLGSSGMYGELSQLAYRRFIQERGLGPSFVCYDWSSSSGSGSVYSEEDVPHLNIDDND